MFILREVWVGVAAFKREVVEPLSLKREYRMCNLTFHFHNPVVRHSWVSAIIATKRDNSLHSSLLAEVAPFQFTVQL